MRVLAIDMAKNAGWVITTEEGEIIQAGIFCEHDADSKSIAPQEDEVSE